MKIFRSMAVAATAVMALGLAACGGGGGGSDSTPAAKTVTVNGSLEPGSAKSTLKTVAAATGSLGSVTAIDAANGAVISTAPVDIIKDSSGVGGTFSGLKITPPTNQAGIILKAVLNNGKSYRLLVTDTLVVDTTLSGKTIGPNSDVIVAKVSGDLAHGGILGDGGVVHTGTTLSTVATKVATVSAEVLPLLSVGYVINTGGSGTKVPGFSIIDRASKTVTKTVRFSNHPGVRVNHFGNVTADGSELWLCSNKAGGAAGDVNVYDAGGFKNYSTLNDSNKGTLIKKAFSGVGCGVQNTQTPDGRYIFVSSDQSPKGVNVFDVKNKAFLGNIVNGNTAPHVGAVSADGKKYYTSTAGSYHVVGYDISGLPATVPTDANKILDVDFGYGNIHALRLHPNGRYLFAGNNTWPVPAGKTSTSGVSVIDLATKTIIKTLPGRPHNFAISLDGKYLISTESTAADCDITPGDPASLLQFIDISTLLEATPDPSKIKDILHYNHIGFGGSHAGWDPVTGLLYYAVSADADGQGWLIKLDTSGLSAATPYVTFIGKDKVGWAPHAVLFPGINSD